MAVSLFYVMQLSAQINVTGTVTDAAGETMPGVNVTVKGTTTGTVTDMDGKYTINVPDNTTVLVFSFIGYTAQEFTVGNQTAISVTLAENTTELDEVVVVGYGVQRKSNLTGSVAVVKAEALSTRPVASISAALAGQMPGVTTITSSGQPGLQTGTITIRGKNTINTGSPLVIVDGVPGSMNDIPMEDVASVSVLKDAASAAIYGVQAANGVILITTKRGTKGDKAKVSYSGNVSWVKPTTQLPFLGSGDYAMLYNEATKNDNPNAVLRWTEEEVQKFYNGSDPANYPNTDWYNETFNPRAVEHSHYLSVNGGSEKTNYNASLQYLNQGGLLDAVNYQRFSGRINLDSQITSWFSAGMDLAAYRGTREDGHTSFAGVMQYVNRISPTEPIYKNDDFNYPGVDNPIASVDRTGFQKWATQQISSNVYGTVHFLPNLSVKGLFSFRNQTQNHQTFKKHLTYSTFNSGDREAYDRYSNWNWYTSQVLANYNESWENHNLALLGGFEQTLYTYNFTEAFRKGGGNDELSSLQTLDVASQTNRNDGRDVARRSFFGRVQYNYNSKYLFEANVRYDGSSLFPEKTRWGVFPAISAGWVLSREDFMSNLSWLSNLKLRAGWGQTGNEELKAEDVYPSVATYAYDKYMFADKLYTTAKETRYVNPELKWATVTNYELGIETSILNNLFAMELAVYKKKTSDMLLYLPITRLLGMPAFAQNAGEVENTGFDLNLSHNNSIGADWKYNVYFTLAYVKNQITNMEGTEGADPADVQKYWFLEGHPIGSFYGYKAIGFFNTDDELKNDAKRTGTEKLGDLKYENLNPDVDNKIDAANDRTVIGKNFPTWTTGLGAGVSYKNFDFYCFFQGALDVDVYTENEMAFSFYNGGKVLERHLDRWTPDNHNATYPRITRSSTTNNQVSSFWLQDASYVRLKNVSLGYTLPATWLDKLGLERIYVYLSGENLLTFSGLEGIDPEAPSVGRGAYYANNKKVSLGLKVSF